MHGGNVVALAGQAGCLPEEILDFSANINPLGPPPSITAALIREAATISRYPDPDCRDLLNQAAAFYQCPAGHIAAGNGVSQLLFALLRAISPKRAVIPAPCYLDYAVAARKAGSEPVFCPLRPENNFRLDPQDLREQLKTGDAVLIGRPNNPTSLSPNRHDLVDLINERRDCVFIIDESFIDFTDQRPLSNQGSNNVVTLRSLTKILAVPGLRIGLLFASENLVKIVQNQLPPWSVNTLAQAAGAAFFKKKEQAAAFIEKSRRFVWRERQKFSTRLQELPDWKVYPAEANYILLRLEGSCRDSRVLRRKWLKQKIAARVCGDYEGLDNSYLRLAVRSADENQRFIEVARTTFTKKSRQAVKKTPALMIQGATSNAGKSVLCAALCRIFLQDGVSVAPFKAQNMSNNSYVTWQGGEIGRAQATQASAARLAPDVRMNPILLKPNSADGSQVILRGQVVGNRDFKGYRAMKTEAQSVARQCYDSLSSNFDLMVIEGAGSPAEINLKGADLVNMAMADHAQAAVCLVGDIDRGGVFASFVGAFALFEAWEKKLLKGFIINRFRGNRDLLDNADSILRDYTGRPLFGVIDYLADLGLPEEDSLSFKEEFPGRRVLTKESIDIAVADFPRLANFTDLDALRAEKEASIRKWDKPEELGRPDLVILPGSKNTAADLKWLKKRGMAAALSEYRAKGGRVLGICGGYQMLGRSFSDPDRIESAAGKTAGLGLLPVDTVLGRQKIRRQTRGLCPDYDLPVSGYEIHHGATTACAGARIWLIDDQGKPLGVSSADNTIQGAYLHGLFDSDRFRRAFLNDLRKARGLNPLTSKVVYDIDRAIDGLAAHVRRRLDLKSLYRILRL